MIQVVLLPRGRFGFTSAGSDRVEQIVIEQNIVRVFDQRTTPAAPGQPALPLRNHLKSRWFPRWFPRWLIEVGRWFPGYVRWFAKMAGWFPLGGSGRLATKR